MSLRVSSLLRNRFSPFRSKENFFCSLLLLSLTGSTKAQAPPPGLRLLPRPGTTTQQQIYYQAYDFTGATVTTVRKNRDGQTTTVNEAGLYGGRPDLDPYARYYLFSNDDAYASEYPYYSVVSTVGGTLTWKWKWVPPLNSATPPVPDYALYPAPPIFTLDALYQECAAFDSFAGVNGIFVDCSLTPLGSNTPLTTFAYDELLYNNTRLISTLSYDNATKTYTKTMRPKMVIDAEAFLSPPGGGDVIGQTYWYAAGASAALVLARNGDANYLFNRPKEKGDGKNQFVYGDFSVASGQTLLHYLGIPALVKIEGGYNHTYPDLITGEPTPQDDIGWLARGRIRIITDIPTSTTATTTVRRVTGLTDFDRVPPGQKDPITPLTTVGNGVQVRDTLLYSGMPTNNAEFGNREVTLQADHRDPISGKRTWRDSMSASIQTFFNPFDKTHPDAPDNPLPGTPPNWFHYYGQEFTPSKPVFYQNPMLINGTTAYTDYTNIYFGRDLIGENYIRTYRLPVYGIYNYPVAGGTTKRLVKVMGYLDLKGIDRFMWVLGHEIGHNLNHNNVIIEVPVGSAFDQDVAYIDPMTGQVANHRGDGLDDRWEAFNNFDPNSQDTVGFYGPMFGYGDEGKADRECLADIRGFSSFLANRLEWQRDWAKESVQWGVHPVSTNTNPYYGWKFYPYNALTGTLGAEQYEITPNQIGVVPLTSITGLDGHGLFP